MSRYLSLFLGCIKRGAYRIMSQYYTLLNLVRLLSQLQSLHYLLLQSFELEILQHLPSDIGEMKGLAVR